MSQREECQLISLVEALAQHLEGIAAEHTGDWKLAYAEAARDVRRFDGGRFTFRVSAPTEPGMSEPPCKCGTWPKGPFGTDRNCPQHGEVAMRSRADSVSSRLPQEKETPICVMCGKRPVTTSAPWLAKYAPSIECYFPSCWECHAEISRSRLPQEERDVSVARIRHEMNAAIIDLMQTEGLTVAQADGFMRAYNGRVVPLMERLAASPQERTPLPEGLEAAIKEAHETLYPFVFGYLTSVDKWPDDVARDHANVSLNRLLRRVAGLVVPSPEAPTPEENL